MYHVSNWIVSSVINNQVLVYHTFYTFPIDIQMCKYIFKSSLRAYSKFSEVMCEKEVNIPSSYTFIMRSHKGFEWHYRRSKVQTPLIQRQDLAWERAGNVSHRDAQKCWFTGALSHINKAHLCISSARNNGGVVRRYNVGEVWQAHASWMLITFPKAHSSMADALESACKRAFLWQQSLIKWFTHSISDWCSLQQPCSLDFVCF